MSKRVVLTGWGRTAPTAADLLVAGDEAGVRAALAGAGPRGVLARGLGRSYGDLAQNAGGTVLALPGLAGITLDEAGGTVTAGAGATFAELLRVLVPRGWFLPVLPGTAHVTVGGAVANDIHGKNHHGHGSLGHHVEELRLALPDGSMRDVGPRDDPELFWATLGGLGLTGVITRGRIRLRPIETAQLLVDTERAGDLDDLLARMAEGDHRYEHSVAWLDLSARGRHLGRGVLTRADHAPADALPADPPALAYAPRVRVTAPVHTPGAALRPSTVRAFNELWFRVVGRPRRQALQDVATFFHPLDRVGEWSRLYGPPGVLQYQLVVPFGQEATLRRLVAALAGDGSTPFLAVLKRFGPRNPGPLSFPMPGWTLAADLPGRAARPEALDAFDRAVVEAGGRVYLAKDARLDPRCVEPMYPRLGAWRAVRRRVDPTGVLQSDLGRRLGLV